MSILIIYYLLQLQLQCIIDREIPTVTMQYDIARHLFTHVNKCLAMSIHIIYDIIYIVLFKLTYIYFKFERQECTYYLWIWLDFRQVSRRTSLFRWFLRFQNTGKLILLTSDPPSTYPQVLHFTHFDVAENEVHSVAKKDRRDIFKCCRKKIPWKV